MILQVDHLPSNQRVIFFFRTYMYLLQEPRKRKNQQLTSKIYIYRNISCIYNMYILIYIYCIILYNILLISVKVSQSNAFVLRNTDSLLGFSNKGHYINQPKQCTSKRKIPQNYHTFALVHPPQI